MQTIEAIRSRRAVHDYSDEPVRDDTLRELLDATRWAPSGWNLQPWELCVLRDDADRRAVRATTYTDQEHVTDAPVVIVVCGRLDPGAHVARAVSDAREKGYVDGERAADIREKVSEMRERPVVARKIWSIRNCMVAATTLLYAAEALGLATCPFTGFDHEELEDAIDAPDELEAVIGVTVGHAAAGAGHDDERPRKWRRDVEDVATFGTFGNSTEPHS